MASERKAGNARRREEFGGPEGLARLFRAGRLDVMPARGADRRAVLEHARYRRA